MADLKLKHYPYRIWKEKPEQKELAEKLIAAAEENSQCLECGGTGSHHCSCGDVHDCGECSGTGLSGEVEKELDYILTSIYSKECASDEMRFLKWRGV